jgi:hypothetical protein
MRAKETQARLSASLPIPVDATADRFEPHHSRKAVKIFAAFEKRLDRHALVLAAGTHTTQSCVNPVSCRGELPLAQHGRRSDRSGGRGTRQPRLLARGSSVQNCHKARENLTMLRAQ